MMITDPLIAEYCEAFTTPTPDLLIQLERETHLKTLAPQMLAGHLQGRLLSMISKLMRPDRILEIGTFTGYGALCLAEGLGDGGKLISLEINEELKPIIEKYIHQSPLANKIDVIFGDATEVIPTLNESFDLVLLDAGKLDYSRHYEMVLEKLKPGGVILADNVLWSGKVVLDDKDNDEDTQAIIAFSNHVRNDKRVEVVMLPVRDGIYMIRKIA